MSLLARPFQAKANAQRTYAAAGYGRQFQDWVALQTSSDVEIRRSIRPLIDRSRSLERDNDYMRGFLGDCEANVIGSADTDLRMEIGDYNKKNAFIPDTSANKTITDAWNDWCKKSNCTISKNRTWHDTKRLALRSAVRDGNFIARFVRGSAAKNKYHFALQLWEVDHLDLLKNEVLPSGNTVRFGIEMDDDKAAVAYWVFATPRSDILMPNPKESYQSMRLPAKDFVHLFMVERTSQSIGVPWIVSAITRLRQLGAYEEAELIAARVASCKMGFFTRDKDASGWTGETASDGSPVTDASPGTFETLPQGWDVKNFDMQHPNQAFPDFRKSMLRGIATGLGTSYVSLGNDLEAVNFSSARVGLLDERETWKMVQKWFKDYFLVPVFEEWLLASLISGAIPLPAFKFDRFNQPKFRARRWSWIDPMKEIEAATRAIDAKLTSRRAVIEEQGGDIEDVFADLSADEALAEAHDIELGPATITAASAKAPTDGSPGEPTKPTGEEADA